MSETIKAITDKRPGELSPDELFNLYLQTGWEDPHNAAPPDPEITSEVLRMLEAPTLKDAMAVNEYWGCWESDEDHAQQVLKLRVLAGVEGGKLTSLLRAANTPLTVAAAVRIEELERRVEDLLMGSSPATR